MLFYILNIAIIAVILLIAYWWASQGLFSALLHLLCVVAAGALALAFWEPLTLGLLLRGGQFDAYAWGVGFIVLFVASLLILRVASDKFVPANVDLPNWANLLFGFPIGLAAGYLTVGLAIIAIGHLPTQRNFLGLDGWQRKSGGQIESVESVPYWSYAPQVATWFYEFVSDGALSTATPLRTHNPELYKQATLVRDGHVTPRGELVSGVSLLPEAVQVLGFIKSPEARIHAVRLKFSRQAFDGRGTQLVLSPAQVRLIGRSRDGSAAIAHPIEFSQHASPTSIGYFKFDTSSHYVTSIAGQESAEVMLVFPLLPGDAEPKFVQIRGTRLALPAQGPQDLVSANAFASMKFTLGKAGATQLATGDPTKPTVTREELALNEALPITTSTNQLPGGMTTEEMDGRQALWDGRADFPKQAERPPIKLMVDKIYQSPGTRIVQLDVSRLRTADIFAFVRRHSLGDAVTPMLVDSHGFTYRAIGYVHDRGDVVGIRLDRHDGISSLAELPQLPSSGSETLKLVFQVTEDVELAAFCLNNVVVANAKQHVPPKVQRQKAAPAGPPPKAPTEDDQPQE